MKHSFIITILTQYASALVEHRYIPLSDHCQPKEVSKLKNVYGLPISPHFPPLECLGRSTSKHSALSGWRPGPWRSRVPSNNSHFAPNKSTTTTTTSTRTSQVPWPPYLLLPKHWPACNGFCSVHPVLYGQVWVLNKILQELQQSHC